MPSTSSDSNRSKETLNEISVLKTQKERILKRKQSYKFTGWGFLLASIIGMAVGLLIAFATADSPDKSIPIEPILVCAVMGNLLYAEMIIAFRVVLSVRLRMIDLNLMKAGATELQENIDDNFFTKLVQINFKYIDQYYLQTQEQADKSFRLSVGAAISGLIIISFGIGMMYFGRTDPAYVTTAAGVIGEFIAAVFFYLYNRTILKMSQYHQKLVLTQNISLALKITEEMEKEQKNKALETIIDRLTTDVNKYLTDTKS